jgi:hypothetical protein
MDENGADTPEQVLKFVPKERPRSCGQRAFIALRSLLEGKSITCRFKQATSKPSHLPRARRQVSGETACREPLRMKRRVSHADPTPFALLPCVALGTQLLSYDPI